MPGSFTQIAEMIHVTETHPLAKQALEQCLCDLDEMWACLDEMTVGGILAFLSCVPGDKTDADEVVRDMLGFLLDTMDAFVSVIRPRIFQCADGQDPVMAMSEGEGKMLGMGRKLNRLGPRLTPLGMFLATNVLLEIPSGWMAYANELSSAAGMIAHSMPDSDAMYHRDLLSRVQEEKLFELMQRVDAWAMSYNSVPFRQAEQWAGRAGPMFEGLLSSGKDEEEAMDEVAGKLGVPWAGVE